MLREYCCEYAQSRHSTYMAGGGGTYVNGLHARACIDHRCINCGQPVGSDLFGYKLAE